MSNALKAYTAGSLAISGGFLILTGNIGLALIVAGALCLLACGIRESLS